MAQLKMKQKYYYQKCPKCDTIGSSQVEKMHCGLIKCIKCNITYCIRCKQIPSSSYHMKCRNPQCLHINFIEDIKIIKQQIVKKHQQNQDKLKKIDIDLTLDENHND